MAYKHCVNLACALLYRSVTSPFGVCASCVMCAGLGDQCVFGENEYVEEEISFNGDRGNHPRYRTNGMREG